MSKLEADINALLVTDQARAFLLLVAREEFWKGQQRVWPPLLASRTGMP
jgi:hypothetical protein